jgi:hypothetical protein
MENPQDSLATPIPMAKDAFLGFSFSGGLQNDAEDSAESNSEEIEQKRTPSSM